jgi:ribosomal protein S18 acetylase RimI-like enzyme
MDNGSIDIFVGSDPSKKIDALICIIDLVKKDSEIKILMGCTKDEKIEIYNFLNNSEFMKAILVKRQARYAENTDYLWLKEHEKYISDKILKRKIETKEVYIVQEDKEIVGWLRYNLFWDNVPFMNKIFLLEEYRRKGIGRKLVNYWEEKMKEQGYQNILTSTQSNEDGQHFYRKIGYTEIGSIKYLEEPLEIIFYKKLS